MRFGAAIVWRSQKQLFWQPGATVKSGSTRSSRVGKDWVIWSPDYYQSDLGTKVIDSVRALTSDVRSRWGTGLACLLAGGGEEPPPPVGTQWIQQGAFLFRSCRSAARISNSLSELWGRVMRFEIWALCKVFRVDSKNVSSELVYVLI